MKILTLLSGICLLFLSFQDSDKETPGSYQVVIVQDGNRITLEKGRQQEFELKRKPFHFEISLHNLEGVMLLACETDTFFNTPDTSEMPTCMMLEGIAVAEEMHNADRSLYVAVNHDDGGNYWYYDSKDANRFDKVMQVAGDTVKAIRTVKRIRTYKQKKEPFKIEQYNGELFLVFLNLKSEKCTYYNWNEQTDRRYVRIRFVQ